MTSFPVSLCDLPWWAVLLSWLLPAVLGYFWGMLQWSRYKSKSKKHEQDLASASRRIVNLEKEVMECRNAYEKVIREKDKIISNATLSNKPSEFKTNPSELGGTPSQINVPPPVDIIHETRTVFGYAIRRNDLKLIDGIDPKVEKVLHEAGIYDWYQLEKADSASLAKILSDAGYASLDSSSWPYQSSLARQEKWDELKQFQSRK